MADAGDNLSFEIDLSVNEKQQQGAKQARVEAEGKLEVEPDLAGASSHNEVEALDAKCAKITPVEVCPLCQDLAKIANVNIFHSTKKKEDTYQILMPLHLESYLAFTSLAEAPEAMLKVVALSLCFSWAHQPTPGHLLVEQHIWECLATNFCLWGVLEDTLIAWVPKLNLNLSPMPMAMASLFFSPKPDMGLDGVFILEDANMEAYEIHTLQVKHSTSFSNIPSIPRPFLLILLRRI